MSITLDLLPEPDSRTAEQGTYDTNKARFTGRSCVAGNVAVEMLPTLPVYPSLARSRNALLSGAACNAASGRGRIMSGSARARNAVLVRCARAVMWPAARAPYVPRRGQRQLRARSQSQRGIVSRPAWTGYGMYWQGHRTVKAVAIDRGHRNTYGGSATFLQ